MSWLRTLFRKVPAVLSADAIDKNIRDAIAANHCPDCHHEGFYAGPEGGMSQNIICANPECCSAFNVTQIGGDIVSAERISNHYWRPPIAKDSNGQVQP